MTVGLCVVITVLTRSGIVPVILYFYLRCLIASIDGYCLSLADCHYNESTYLNSEMPMCMLSVCCMRGNLVFTAAVL